MQNITQNHIDNCLICLIEIKEHGSCTLMAAVSENPTKEPIRSLPPLLHHINYSDEHTVELIRICMSISSQMECERYFYKELPLMSLHCVDSILETGKIDINSTKGIDYGVSFPFCTPLFYISTFSIYEDFYSIEKCRKLLLYGANIFAKNLKNVHSPQYNMTVFNFNKDPKLKTLFNGWIRALKMIKRIRMKKMIAIQEILTQYIPSDIVRSHMMQSSFPLVLL